MCLSRRVCRVWADCGLPPPRACAAGGQWDDGKQLIGRRVFVDGYGEGTVREFKKKTLPKFGASAHAIDFNPAGAEHDPAMVSLFVPLPNRSLAAAAASSNWGRQPCAKLLDIHCLNTVA